MYINTFILLVSINTIFYESQSDKLFTYPYSDGKFIQNKLFL